MKHWKRWMGNKIFVWKLKWKRICIWMKLYFCIHNLYLVAYNVCTDTEKNQLIKVTYCWPKKKEYTVDQTKRWISTKLSHGGKKVIRFLHANVVYIMHAMLNKLRIYWVNIYTAWVRMCLYMSMHAVLFVSFLTMLAISHNSRIFLSSNYIFYS